MKAKRLLSLLLTLCMVFSIVAMSAGTAFAAGNDKAIAGLEVLEEKMNQTKAATVYYGDTAWHVIGYNGMEKSVASTEGNLTLLSDTFMGWVYFNEASNKNNKYAGSLLQTTVNSVAEGLFTPEEKAAIMLRTLEVGEETGKEKDEENGNKNTLSCDGVAGTAVENAMLWPLSTLEAKSVTTQLRQMASYTYTKSDGSQATEMCFWTRSPSTDATTAGFIYKDGTTITMQGVTSKQAGVRPAFNLKLDSILMVSAAEGGKAGTGIAPVGDYKKTVWKLTILDTNRTFTASVASENGNVVTVNYSGAKTGSNEFLSVVIKNSITGDITEYGRVKNLTAASGSVDIDLTGIDMKGKTLYVFNEQYNGGAEDKTKKTDYGSQLVELQVSLAPAVSDAVKAVQAQIDALPEEDDIELTHKAAIDAAKAAYEALSADDKAIISKDKLDKAMEALKELEGAAAPGTSENAGNNDANNNTGNDGTNKGDDKNDNKPSNNKKPAGNNNTVSGGAVIALWIALIVVLCGSIAAAVIFILKMKKIEPKAEAVEVAEEAEVAEEVKEDTEE